MAEPGARTIPGRAPPAGDGPLLGRVHFFSSKKLENLIKILKTNKIN
jgi:hypothetical protein